MGYFTVDYSSAIILAVIVPMMMILYWKTTPRLLPALSFPKLAELKLYALKCNSWRTKLGHYPHKLHKAALICFMLAFIDPHLLVPNTIEQPHIHHVQQFPSKGLAIYLVLDQSGSMAESVRVRYDSGESTNISKINLMKQVTHQFIINHSSDLIGLVAFARIPRILVPLTLDQSTLLSQLENIQIVHDSTQDGTAIGYAIFKTANLIAVTKHFAEDLQQTGQQPPYTIKNAVMVVVTDGFQDPSELDQGNRLRMMELDDAAAYVKTQSIHLYVINIDPNFASEAYAPHRRQLKKITQYADGGFYMANDSQQLAAVYRDIDKLEGGKIIKIVETQPTNQTQDRVRLSFYPYIIALGMVCIFCALCLEFLILKKVP